MSEKRKQYQFNDIDIVVNADNVLYNGITGTDNVDGALDNIVGRVNTLEQVNDSSNDAQREVIYTQDDCTIIDKYLYTNTGTPSNDTNYNCSELLPIPANAIARMYIKTNTTITSNHVFSFWKPTKHDANGNEIIPGSPYSVIYGDNIDSSGEYVEYPIPAGSMYIRFNFNKSNPNNYMYVKFVYDEKGINNSDVVKLKIASWNIGGFANGGGSSNITDENADEKREAYLKQIDETNADIICVSEYASVFNPTTSSSTRNEIFFDYPYAKIGPSQSYNFNCIFSKFPIIETREFYYSGNALNLTQNRYWEEATIKINGKIVKVVATHLETNSKYIEELQELIDRYANDPYVIIGADFNIHTTDTWGDYVDGSGTDGYKNYQQLIDAGYTLMNFDRRMLVNPWRFPPDDPLKPNQLKGSTADNIAVKGFAMGKREYVYTENVSNELSDHAMVACELVML